jgi:serine O-acetyltransferase
MISTKKELKYYLAQDALALNHKGRKKPKIFGDEIWKFQITLRKTEYYSNRYKSSKRYIFSYFWNKAKLHKMSVKLGFSIPLNVFGPGLAIVHYGTIVVSPAAKIGKNCRLHEGVNIAATNGSSRAPIIGDNVFIGWGATILPGTTIGNNTIIGAGAVVKGDVEGGYVYAGNPAKRIVSIEDFYNKRINEQVDEAFSIYDLYTARCGMKLEEKAFFGYESLWNPAKYKHCKWASFGEFCAHAKRKQDIERGV